MAPHCFVATPYQVNESVLGWLGLVVTLALCCVVVWLHTHTRVTTGDRRAQERGEDAT